MYITRVASHNNRTSKGNILQHSKSWEKGAGRKKERIDDPGRKRHLSASPLLAPLYLETFSRVLTILTSLAKAGKATVNLQ